MNPSDILRSGDPIRSHYVKHEQNFESFVGMYRGALV